jgi:hypothetical protein
MLPDTPTPSATHFADAYLLPQYIRDFMLGSYLIVDENSVAPYYGDEAVGTTGAGRSGSALRTDPRLSPLAARSFWR